MILTSTGRAAGIVLLATGLLAGCAGHAGTSEDVGRVSEALDICSETVPANRNVDGIPAYAQCTAAENSAIYSDNGVNTSTSSMGNGWVRTQYNSGYQCTEFAYRYLHFRWSISWEPNGNAGTWCDSTPPSSSGVVQTSTPVHGDLIVFPPGTCGSDPTAGHVAVVDTVSGTTSVSAVEQNSASRSTYKQSCAKCFLHVVTNSGSDAASPTGDRDAASGGGTDATTVAMSTPDSAAPFDAGAARPPPGPTASDDGGGFASSPEDAETADDAAIRADAGSSQDTPASWGSDPGAAKGCSASGQGVPGGDARAHVVLVGLALAGLWMRTRRRRAR